MGLGSGMALWHAGGGDRGGAGEMGGDLEIQGEKLGEEVCLAWNP